MHAPDPYAFIEELSRVSSSQEERLRRCRFTLEPEPIKDDDDDDDEDEDDDQFRVEPSRIVMVSPPETPEAGGNDENVPPREDVFHTPPEESLLAGSRQNSATVDVPASGEAVDLGRDTDPGFGSEVELRERPEGGEVQEEIRVVDRGLGLHSEAERNLGVSSNSGEKLNSQSKRLKISDQPKGLRDGSGIAGGPDRGEVGVSNHEGASVLVRKSINDIDKFRYGGPSYSEKGKDAGSRGKRALPKSIRGWMDDEAKEDNEFTLLDVLEILAKDCHHDPDAERLSVFEAAKKRGITFP